MDKNEAKLELGSKTEPHLTKHCEMQVGWNGGIGYGTKEIQTYGKLMCFATLSQRVTEEMMTKCFFLFLQVE